MDAIDDDIGVEREAKLFADIVKDDAVARTLLELGFVEKPSDLLKVVIDATRRLGISTCWIGPGANQKSVTAALGSRFDPEAAIHAVSFAGQVLPIVLIRSGQAISGQGG